MQRYNCKVRLAGGVSNEVPKVGVTAPEIYILRSIHGQDSVVSIVPTHMDKKPHAELREELQNRYRTVPVNRMFSPHQSLPVRLDDQTEAEILAMVEEKERDLRAREIAEERAKEAEEKLVSQAEEIAELRAALRDRDVALDALKKVDQSAVNGEGEPLGHSPEVGEMDGSGAEPDGVDDGTPGDADDTTEEDDGGQAEGTPTIDKNGPPPPADKPAKAKAKK